MRLDIPRPLRCKDVRHDFPNLAAYICDLDDLQSQHDWRVKGIFCHTLALPSR